MEAPEEAARAHGAKLIVAICAAQFLVIVDVAIINVALPSIQTGLGFSDTGLQWVVNAYTLSLAGFLMLGGRACDLFGQRRVFIFGLVLFTGSSLACALAGSAETLVGFRAVQGVGGAILSPASLAILSSSFPDGHERNRALGAWAAMGGIGGTFGMLLGGVLTQAFGWPAIFLINVPLGLLVVYVSLGMVPAGPPRHPDRRIDLLGAILVTLGLSLVVSASFAARPSAGARPESGRRCSPAPSRSSSSAGSRRGRRTRWCRRGCCAGRCCGGATRS